MLGVRSSHVKTNCCKFLRYALIRASKRATDVGCHGRNTTLTLVRVSEWFKATRDFIAFLEIEFA
jgi:hypothetical protein